MAQKHNRQRGRRGRGCGEEGKGRKGWEKDQKKGEEDQVSTKCPMPHPSNMLHRKTSANKAQEEAAANAAAKTLQYVPTHPILISADPFP